MKRRRSRWLPIPYLVVGGLLVTVALPSALRPPPDETSAGAELSPDAPPEGDPEAIIQSLQQARSRTAGATGQPVGADGVETTTTTTTTMPPRQRAPTRGQCYGDPARTTESLYAAPCVPAWQGSDNGGATHKNVFPDEVRVGVSHVLGNATEGPGRIQDEPPSGESSAYRTLRVLQAYFNQNYELYGRRFQIYQLPASSADPVEGKNHAVQADTDYGLFGAYYLYSGFCAEFARRDLVMFCNPMPSEFHERHSPKMWAWMMDYSKVDRMGAEYICKKLEGKTADFAGGLQQGKPRKFGLLYETADARNAGRNDAFMASQLAEQCGLGADDVVAITVDTTGGQVTQRWAEAIARFNVAGVTSIVLQTEFTPAFQIMTAADGSNYFPEWLLFFPYGLDFNAIGALLPQGQMVHAFGLSAWEQPAPNLQTDCFRAYKTIDPAGTPNNTTCNLFFPNLQQLANGFQEAGPNLTPETFRDGLFKQGHRFYPQPWAIGGGFGPGDWTYMDNMGEIWWDPDDAKPEDGTAGAYRWVRNGQRYREGEQPVEDPLVFQDGTATRVE